MDQPIDERVLQHKLLEPTTIILGQVSILLEGLSGELSHVQKDRLLKIQAAAEKLTSNIREYIIPIIKGNPI
ncbi:hypothetical protein HZC35_06525 [Candidatus Saganbacteria bacterium]|nr:hypothetical protein [Candidatus Saganbacteria bacterium]